MEKIQLQLIGEIISSNDAEAHSLYQKSCFGEPKGEKILYTLSEALFLLEKGKAEILSRDNKLSVKDLLKKLQRIDKKIQIKYLVFNDLRERGYIVKTALKFGADFRVYDKGKHPGKEHAKWILFVEHESKKMALHEFTAKNRVAHSTKKKLLFAIVDEEGDVSYYEASWIRP